MSNETVRAASVPVATFIAGIMTGHKNGSTNAEVAQALGMNMSSFNVRKSQINKNPPKEIAAAFEKQGKKFSLPSLRNSRSASTRAEVVGLASQLLDMLDSDEVPVDTTGETGDTGSTGEATDAASV